MRATSVEVESESPPAGAEAVPHIDPAVLSRRLTYIMLVRVILFTLILGGTVAVNLAWGTPEELGGPYVTFLFVFIAAVYLLNIVYALLLRAVSNVVALALVQLAGDLVTAAILVHATGGAESGFVLFFLLTPIAAAVSLDRRTALLTAVAAVGVFALVSVLGYVRWLPPVPGPMPLPWELTPGALGRSLLVNGAATMAVAALAGYLAEQLRFAAEKVEVQQAHIHDLAALNQDIIRCLTSGLVTVDMEGTILTINQAALEILALKRPPPPDTPLAELCPELIEAMGQPVHRGEIPCTRDGMTRLLAVSISPLVDHLNQLRGQVINFQDMTAVREMEQTIKRSEHLASLGRMAAAIAHEIRNPLASISGSLELLRAADQLDADDRKLMEIALREIGRLNNLVTSFLDYARPKPPELAPLDLGREIHALVQSITRLLGGPPAPPVTVVGTEPGLHVLADRDQLQAILWNLVRNALEAGEHDRIRVHVTKREPDRVVLKVTDDAGGIAADLRERIFEPFFTSKETGTGLGLSTVQRMVHDHGGSIQVATTEGQGTTFSIELPYRPPED